MSARGEPGRFFSANQDAVAPVGRQLFENIVAVIRAANFFDIFDAHWHHKSIFERAALDFPHAALIDALADVTRQCARGWAVCFIIGDHPSQRLNEW